MTFSLQRLRSVQRMVCSNGKNYRSLHQINVLRRTRYLLAPEFSDWEEKVHSFQENVETGLQSFRIQCPNIVAVLVKSNDFSDTQLDFRFLSPEGFYVPIRATKMMKRVCFWQWRGSGAVKWSNYSWRCACAVLEVSDGHRFGIETRTMVYLVLDAPFVPRNEKIGTLGIMSRLLWI